MTRAEHPSPQRLRPNDPQYRQYLIGAMIILLGILALLATLTESVFIGEAMVLSIGLAFVAWGTLARQPGLMIPGGILSGIGVGVLLSQYVFAGASGEVQGGVITLCMGLGFLLIMPLQQYLTAVDRFSWWPAIPGGILSFVGLSLLLGGVGLTALSWLGRLWPLALIIAGAVILYRALGIRQQRADATSDPTPLEQTTIESKGAADSLMTEQPPEPVAKS
jgi:hypothetical protein